MTTQPLPPRPDGMHPAPPMPPMPPRPDAVDGGPPPLDGAQGLAARPKATWSWYEAIGVYIVGFLVAGIATIPLIRVMDADTDLTNIVLSVVAALAILAVLVGWLSMYHKGWVRIIGVPAKGEWGKQVGGGVVPSHHERERYCRTDQPDRCPTFDEYVRAGQLTEERYYTIWIAPALPAPVKKSPPAAEERGAAGMACTL